MDVSKGRCWVSEVTQIIWHGPMFCHHLQCDASLSVHVHVVSTFLDLRGNVLVRFLLDFYIFRFVCRYQLSWVAYVKIDALGPT
jgi:hypothetical protein